MNKLSGSRFVRPLMLYVGLALLVGGRSSGAAAELQAPAAVGTTTRISVSSSGVGANDQSYTPSLSDNGRYVAFESLASNLVAGDTNDKWDVFVHDRQTGITERLSVAADGTQGNGDSYGANISADGRFITFTSQADNLILDESNSGANVYLKDRTTGQIEIISVLPTGEAGGCSGHYSAISNNYRYIAFYSCHDDLTSGDTNGTFDVYLRDRWTDQTRRVSIGPGGAQGNNSSWGPISISADGSEVFFASWATNLVNNDKNDTLDAFVHNWVTGVTKILSVSTNNEQGNFDTGSIYSSADGNIVSFDSYASTFVANDQNGIRDVFIRNRATGETRRISVASDGSEVYSSSFLGKISPDGRFVAFSSYSTDLVDQDTNGFPDIFVHDAQTGRTNRVSISSSGAQANDESFYTMDISLDGRVVAFVSKATNLVSNSSDTNNTWDIFVHEYSPCYGLITNSKGSGNDPTASPDQSNGCELGTYYGGEQITLTASPAADWRIKNWSGTNNNSSTSVTNTTTMPARDHIVSVTYEPIPAVFHRLYAPLTLFVSPPACFAGPDEIEPNNDAYQANGPLCHGATIRGWPEDTFDYFMFDTTRPGRVAATVSDHYGEGVQLALYFGSCCDPGHRVVVDTGQADGLDVEYNAGQPGRFYIVIYSANPKPGETRPYTLVMDYP